MNIKTKFNYREATFRICIDRYQGGRMEGRVYSERLKSPICFSDWGSLLLQLDDVMDLQRQPQAFLKQREFGETAPSIPSGLADPALPYMDRETVTAAQGTLLTLLVNVISRQHASWQGVAEVVGAEGRHPFSSDMELLLFIEGRLLELEP
ncbi:MAG: hypothetical protein GXX99_01255 [Clostridiales bacterium]|nr:hypothetical protein [Clostridiales bacterium]